MKKGDIVDFFFPGFQYMGKIKGLYVADVEIAKIRCEVDQYERLFYVPVDQLRPARYPHYYSEEKEDTSS